MFCFYCDGTGSRLAKRCLHPVPEFADEPRCQCVRQKVTCDSCEGSGRQCSRCKVSVPRGDAACARCLSMADECPVCGDSFWPAPLRDGSVTQICEGCEHEEQEKQWSAVDEYFWNKHYY